MSTANLSPHAGLGWGIEPMTAEVKGECVSKCWNFKNTLSILRMSNEIEQTSSSHQF